MMSRRSSRPSSAASHSSSRSSNSDGEFKLECKAAYLSVFDDIRDEITSKNDLISVLQQSGRNPSQRTLEKYWKDETDSLTFNDFVDICRRERVTTADDLMKAFRKIDVNGDGYISLKELRDTLTSKGEKMSEDEVRAMIDEVDENRDGRLDYAEFCNMMMKTVEESRKMGMKIMEKKERKKQRNKQSVTPRKDKEEEDTQSSRTSLRSGSIQPKNKEEEDIQSSRTSLRSGSIQPKNKEEDIKSSRTSLRSGSIELKNKEEDIKSSRTSLRSGSKHKEEDIKSSRTSLHSGSIEPKNKEEDIKSSRTSLRSGSIESKNKEEDIHSSRTSLRSGSIQPKNKDEEDIKSSRTSLRSGSKQPKNKDEEDIKSSRTSLRSESKQPKNNDEEDIQSSRTSLRSGSIQSKKRRGSKSSMISIDDLPKPSPRVNRDRTQPAVKSHLQEPNGLKGWTQNSSKGCFYLEDSKIISHQYSLNLPENTNVWITIEPIRIGKGGVTEDGSPVDTALFILKDRGHRVVTFTEQRDVKGKHGVRCDLDAGRYKLIPFSTGCRLRPDRHHPKHDAKLVQNDKHNNYILTSVFRKALDEIFDMVDLDGNGLLSREEFNLYTWRTSGDEVADEEWEVVETNCDLEDGQITRKGFLHLTEMEAKESDGDEKDLWITLENMGYNRSLVLCEACPFEVNVYSQDCRDAQLKVTTNEPSDDHVEEAVCESVIAKGDSIKIKAMRDLTLHNYIGDSRATLVVKNGSSTQVSVELDCSSSRNCISNHNKLRHTVSVPAQTTVIGHHLVPDDDRSEWTFRCTEKIVK